MKAAPSAPRPRSHIHRGRTVRYEGGETLGSPGLDPVKRPYVREAGVNRPVIRDGELCLVPKPGLLAAVWDSVMAIPEFIQRKPGRGMYIIPVLGLPDMEENEAIRDMAARRHVEVIFGKAD